MAKSTATTMEKLMQDVEVSPLATGEVVEGKVLDARKNEVWIDLGPRGVGLVSRREMGFSQNQFDIGSSVTASVIDPEAEGGFPLLSLRKAAKDRGWDELVSLHKSGEVVEVSAYDANRGGLLIELEGIRGFLPVSQLSAEHYPRVSGADKDEILGKLQPLVRKPLKLRILDVDRDQNKLIFSEREAVRENIQKRLGELKEGGVVEGLVTGVVDFGAFVNVDGVEGLVHISELSWDRVQSTSDYVKPGDKIKAKIIAIDRDRLSLSVKQLQEDPWVQQVEKYKVGDSVEGTVTRITPFGAFIQLSPAVEALVHISELSDKAPAKPEEIFKLHETKTFTILGIDKESRKISLSLRGSADQKAKSSKKS